MKPVRFIHTSDVHLDTSFSGSGFPSRLGDRKREAIRGTFRRIMDDARTSDADFVLIAGDLFELERITPDTFEFLKRQFESLGSIRVFIAPGNHDPCVQGSPYREEAWPANVHIFNAEEFQSVELPELGVRVTGFGFTHTQMDAHHFQQLPILPTELFNIVVTHGSDVSRVPAGKSKHGPFTIEEIIGKNVQYCALGHYHQQHMVSNPVDDTLAWYSGIPEGRGWDEEGACGYLVGEIEDGRVRVESRICSQYDLNTLTVNCDSFATREQILDSILERRGVGFNSKSILRVQLTGAMDPRLDLSLTELEERLAGEVLHIRWEDQTHPALDFDSIALEKTLRGRFVRILNERIADAAENERTVLERARLYGVQALSGREVRLR
ncbi:MAG TPA: DNA repair exonuclease [Acidobacteriota bacterium]|nr:DNA repair exonuclease [Acidobacteriota bacterium]